MAHTLKCAFSHILILVGSLSILLVTPSSCFSPNKVVNVTSSNSNWSPSVATWYGPPTGDGSEGGACGYGNAVGQPPLSSMISAGSPLIYQSGKGCGSCYEVKCIGNPACSGNPVTVTITDECPGTCGSDSPYHFDLSGRAFGAMANSGQDGNLRKVGKIVVQHRRVPCIYNGVSIAFHVDSKSNPYYFATAVEYENGDGDLKKVELMEAFGNTWVTMQQSYGAVWKYNKQSLLRAPFSIRLTTIESGKIFVAKNVIPAGWKPGQTYRALGNFI
uniref:Expansin-B15-like n=1 Tax=Cicer arietinum TaxID=3827 RepID=A0A3Q7Y7C9_CICAR|nr:expansin-B15-like [Cicer arietinum]